MQAGDNHPHRGDTAGEKQLGPNPALTSQPPRHHQPTGDERANSAGTGQRHQLRGGIHDQRGDQSTGPNRHAQHVPCHDQLAGNR
jgi:hypothetical protein